MPGEAFLPGASFSFFFHCKDSSCLPLHMAGVPYFHLQLSHREIPGVSSSYKYTSPVGSGPTFTTALISSPALGPSANTVTLGHRHYTPPLYT